MLYPNHFLSISIEPSKNISSSPGFEMFNGSFARLYELVMKDYLFDCVNDPLLRVIYLEMVCFVWR